MTPLLPDLAPLKALAPTSGDWLAILPEILVAGLGLFALLQSLILPARGRWLIPAFARIGLVLAAVLAWYPPCLPESGQFPDELFGGLLTQQDVLWRLLFIGCALLASLMASRFFRARDADDAEYHHVLLLVTAALMVLAMAHHVVTFFVALETATVGLYILVGFLRKSTASLEAGVKYLVAGGLSSALLLMGFVLLYGFTGMTQPGVDALSFAGITQAVSAAPNDPLMLVGAALVLCGVAFKLGAFPFHGWIPDVYQGAPTPTTAVLATSSKAAGAIALLLLVNQGPLVGISDKVCAVLAVLAGGSLLAGNLGALGSTQAKRALALSGVSHVGFLLAGIVASQGIITGVAIIYLIPYAIATFATLGALAAIPAESDDRRPLLGLRGLIRRSGSLTASLTLGIGSLAGVPPSLGFFAKIMVLQMLVQAGCWGLLTLAVISVAISIHYYFSIIREATSRTAPEGDADPIDAPWVSRAIPLALGILTVVGGFLYLVDRVAAWGAAGG